MHNHDRLCLATLWSYPMLSHATLRYAMLSYAKLCVAVLCGQAWQSMAELGDAMHGMATKGKA